MEYVGAAFGPVVNSPNMDKGITTHAININYNYYMENIKNLTINTTNILHLFKRILQT